MYLLWQALPWPTILGLTLERDTEVMAVYLEQLARYMVLRFRCQTGGIQTHTDILGHIGPGSIGPGLSVSGIQLDGGIHTVHHTINKRLAYCHSRRGPVPH